MSKIYMNIRTGEYCEMENHLPGWIIPMLHKKDGKLYHYRKVDDKVKEVKVIV